MKKAEILGSFDIVGDIAIADVPEGVNDEDIAKFLKEKHKHLKTIYKKSSERKGKLRLRELKKIWGDGPETIHTEHGCRFKVNVESCYFSPREGTERQRIAEQVKPNETVLVMFAGVGAYAVAIGHKQPGVKKIYAVEINPDCVRYMEENIKMNRLSYKVEPILGDVNDKCKKFYGRCNRVIMPLPKEGYKYLPIALQCLKPGGKIHFYYIGLGDKLFETAARVVGMECKKLSKKFKILGQKKVLPYSPGAYKICVDFEVKR